MNLYLISQTVNPGYDTFDSAVVVAESEEVARSIHPDGTVLDETTKQYSWCSKKDVMVHLIGTASEEILSLIKNETARTKIVTDGVSGIICASYNAG